MAAGRKAVYAKTPGKETPLRDPHSKVLHYWTADTDLQDGRRACAIVCHGRVFSKMKADGQDSLSFRAVREIRGAFSGQPGSSARAA